MYSQAFMMIRSQFVLYLVFLSGFWRIQTINSSNNSSYPIIILGSFGEPSWAQTGAATI